jgi:hypothetical protein
MAAGTWRYRIAARWHCEVPPSRRYAYSYGYELSQLFLTTLPA